MGGGLYSQEEQEGYREFGGGEIYRFRGRANVLHFFPALTAATISIFLSKFKQDFVPRMD
ncbi:MAG: hypothetical protein JWM16_6140 [Verrucomicrobiales bacterium]|nr:hypothetical protein [Verrucomicrobiales bacterium]